jgi:hypothetical protein
MSGLLVHVVFAGADFLALVLLFRFIKRLSRFWGARQKPIAGASPGKALFHGTVEPLEKVLESPLRKTPCVYCEVAMERWDRAGSRDPWIPHGDFAESVPFMLKDPTGKIRVESDHIEAIFPLMPSPRISLQNPKIDDVESLFRKVHREGEPHSDLRLFQASESTIQPGAIVFIMGSVTSRNGVLVLTGGKDPLYISPLSFHHVVRRTLLSIFLSLLLACVFAVGIFAPF